MSTFEWNYGYDTEKNNYPLEQLKADIERMINTDKEFIEAINTFIILILKSMVILAI